MHVFNEQYVLSKEKIVGTRYGQDLGIEVIRRVSELMQLRESHVADFGSNRKELHIPLKFCFLGVCMWWIFVPSAIHRADNRGA